MNFTAFLATLGTRVQTLPIVILYVTSACNLRCITCSYRQALPNELSLQEYRELSKQLARLGLRRVVYSGGEPLLRKDLPEICKTFAEHRIKQSLLTNGLLLEKRINELQPHLDEVIVSLDGPDAASHNAIRGVQCFDQIVRGIETIVARQPRPMVSIRMVIQRRNFRHVDDMVDFAKRIGVDRVSFLTADVLSDAFHRDHVGSIAPDADILLTAGETGEFRSLVTGMIGSRRAEIGSGFISEGSAKLMHLVEYFEAFHGLARFPLNSCNAPNISTVITSTGELLPCYFLPAYGNLRSGQLKEQLNNDLIRFTRKQVRDYRIDQCRKCVCTLRITPGAAFRDKF